jgi:hypothetical protein
MAHYYVKDSFEPLLISPFLNKTDSTMSILVVSDYVNRVITDTMEVNIYSLKNRLDAKLKKRIAFEIVNQTSELVFKENSSVIEQTTGCRFNGNPDKNCLLEVKTSSTGLKNYFFFTDKFNQANNLNQVEVYNIQQTSPNTFDISVRSNADYVVLFVWLDIQNTNIVGIFSDNGFHMTTADRTVTFTAATTVTVADMKTYMNVKSIVPFQ